MITGGKVSFRRVKQPAPYESAESFVELVVSLEDENDDSAIKGALERAKAIVLESLVSKSISEKSPVSSSRAEVDEAKQRMQKSAASHPAQKALEERNATGKAGFDVEEEKKRAVKKLMEHGEALKSANGDEEKKLIIANIRKIEQYFASKKAVGDIKEEDYQDISGIANALLNG